MRVAVVFGAGEPLFCNGGGANGLIALAADDVSVAAERFLVKGEHLVLRVGSLVVDDLDAKLPLAEAQVHVGGFVAFFVGCDGGSGIDGKANVGGIGVAGADVEATERRIDLDVLLAAVGALVFLKAAAGCQQQTDGGAEGEGLFHSTVSPGKISA